MGVVGKKLLVTYWQEEELSGFFCTRCEEMIIDRMFRNWLQMGDAIDGKFVPTHVTLCECCYVIITYPEHDIDTKD